MWMYLCARSMESHRVQEMMLLMASKIRAIANTISDEDVEKFLAELLKAKRIYVIGAGRFGPGRKSFCHAAHAPGVPGIRGG